LICLRIVNTDHACPELTYDGDLAQPPRDGFASASMLIPLLCAYRLLLEPIVALEYPPEQSRRTGDDDDDVTNEASRGIHNCVYIDIFEIG